MQHINNLDWPVSRLISMFKEGEIQIPEIQREVVWDASQIKTLVDSIYYDYPCGSLILWQPRIKDESKLKNIIKPERLKAFHRLPAYFLIDGQQRLSAIASVMLQPEFFKNIEEDEVEYKFSSFFINLDQLIKKEGTIEIEESSDGSKYSWPWVLVNKLFNNDLQNNQNFKKLTFDERCRIEQFCERIKQYEFPIQIVTERGYSEVSKIFSRVNSLGTNLVGAEIRMAEIVPHWPGVAMEFRNYLKELKSDNYIMDFAFLLRCLVTIANDSSDTQRFSEKVAVGRFTRNFLKKKWRDCQQSINKLVKLLKKEAFLDNSKYLISRNSLVPLVYYINKNGKRKIDMKSLLGFFYLSQLGSHYSHGTEGVLKKDIKSIHDPSSAKEGLRDLFDMVKQEAKQDYRGVKIKADSVRGLPSKNVLLLLMYLSMAKAKAKDFSNKKPKLFSEIEPKNMHLHHIFPYDVMMNSPESKKYREERDMSLSDFKQEVNDIANLTFISGSEANSKIKNFPPSQYLSDFTSNENLKAHFIPTDKELWTIRNFDKFLKERRILLANAMNKLLHKYR